MLLRRTPTRRADDATLVGPTVTMRRWYKEMVVRGSLPTALPPGVDREPSGRTSWTTRQRVRPFAAPRASCPSTSCVA